MNEQATIIRVAQARGLDVSELSEKEYHKLRLEIRTTKEIIEDGQAMLMGRAKVALNVGLVPIKKKAENLTKCRSNRCGSYGTIAGGSIEVCHRCNCTGKDLNNKTALATEYCPAGEWDNRTEITVNGKRP